MCNILKFVVIVYTTEYMHWLFYTLLYYALDKFIFRKLYFYEIKWCLYLQANIPKKKVQNLFYAKDLKYLNKYFDGFRNEYIYICRVPVKDTEKKRRRRIFDAFVRFNFYFHI